MGANQEAIIAQGLTAPETQIGREAFPLRDETTWFVGVDRGSLGRRYYSKDEVTTALRTGILEGEYRPDCTVVVHSKTQDGSWKETETSLFEFAKGRFKLRSLYQPVWSHALEGLKWGAVAGVALKLCDTLLLLGSADPKLAFLFLVAIGLCCIPRVGVLGMVLISFFMMQYSKVNFFIVGLAAAAIGAVLGCLPGMAVGGIVGFWRKHTLEHAQNTPPEPPGLLWKAVLLPLTGGAGLIALYLFVFNPWLTRMLR